jgi:glycosyltransferase involved in cell wall biosynthesis
MRRVAVVSKARPFSFAWCTAHLERFVLPRTGGVICATVHTRRQVEGLARRTWLVPNAVDRSFFDLENRPCASRILLCVATISVLKNQIGLIRALEPLAAAENVKVIFLGGFNRSDPYYHEFVELVRARPWCEHAGFASREALKSWLQRATALLLPSFEENCPMAILEAMAAGVPVVASEVGGIPELIENGVTGFLCHPSDNESIRSAAQTVLGQPEHARFIARRAKEHAQRRLQPKIVAAQHLEIFREILPPLSALKEF